MDKSNPMAVKYYSTKVEFQGRGAAHNHGVLWVDINKIEFYMRNEDGQWNEIEDMLSSKKELTKKCGENYVKNIKHIIKDLILKKYQENSEGEDKNGMSVYEEINKILCIKPDEDRRETPADALISRFPLLGITSAFKKFQTHEPLLPYEEAAIIQFANKYTTS